MHDNPINNGAGVESLEHNILQLANNNNAGEPAGVPHKNNINENNVGVKENII